MMIVTIIKVPAALCTKRQSPDQWQAFCSLTPSYEHVEEGKHKGSSLHSIPTEAF